MDTGCCKKPNLQGANVASAVGQDGALPAHQQAMGAAEKVKAALGMGLAHYSGQAAYAVAPAGLALRVQSRVIAAHMPLAVIAEMCCRHQLLLLVTWLARSLAMRIYDLLGWCGACRRGLRSNQVLQCIIFLEPCCSGGWNGRNRFADGARDVGNILIL